MPDQAKNALIGLFIITAIAIIIYILLFLHPSTGNEEQILRVRFVNIDKVTRGTRVLFAGEPVGEVADVHEVPNARAKENVINGQVYIFELTLKIDSRVEVYTTDKISVHTAGLLGEKSVEIDPVAQKPGVSLVRVEDHILYATPSVSVDDTLQDIMKISAKAQLALDKVNDQLDIIKNEHFWENLASSARNIKEITQTINDPEFLSQTLTNIREASVNFKDAGENVKMTTAGLREGRGTLGRLFVKDDVYLQLNSVMSKAQTIMDDINHYGLLFQNDKSWQRLRARRMNLMAKLSTPQEFQNYFNDEVDQISTSLSRVSMVLKQTDNCCIPVVCSPDFVKVFGELLLRVESLEKDIKLYNEQVVEIREKDCAFCH